MTYESQNAYFQYHPAKIIIIVTFGSTSTPQKNPDPHTAKKSQNRKISGGREKVLLFSSRHHVANRLYQAAFFACRSPNASRPWPVLPFPQAMMMIMVEIYQLSPPVPFTNTFLCQPLNSPVLSFDSPFLSKALLLASSPPSIFPFCQPSPPLSEKEGNRANGWSVRKERKKE